METSPIERMVYTAKGVLPDGPAPREADTS